MSKDEILEAIGNMSVIELVERTPAAEPEAETKAEIKADTKADTKGATKVAKTKTKKAAE